jgi:hypothetical protein
VDKWPQQSGSAETVQVHARFTQPAASAYYVVDAEGAADQGVDVDAPSENVASGADEVEGVAGCGELVEDFCGDEGEVVACGVPEVGLSL